MCHMCASDDPNMVQTLISTVAHVVEGFLVSAISKHTGPASSRILFHAQWLLYIVGLQEIHVLERPCVNTSSQYWQKFLLK